MLPLKVKDQRQLTGLDAFFPENIANNMIVLRNPKVNGASFLETNKRLYLKRIATPFAMVVEPWRPEENFEALLSPEGRQDAE
jgi:hypothetical protein